MLVLNDPEMRTLPTHIHWDKNDEQDREPEDEDDDDEDEEDGSVSDEDDDEEFLAEKIIMCSACFYPVLKFYLSGTRCSRSNNKPDRYGTTPIPGQRHPHPYRLRPPKHGLHSSHSSTQKQ